MTKKPHWTQTPDGRIRMGEIQKKAWAAKRANRESAAQRKVANAALKFRSSIKRGETGRRSEGTTVVIQGWRITLAEDIIRIERD
jgi:hypothetical protein